MPRLDTKKTTIKHGAWLQDFLHSRTLRAPDQRALYEYHCSHNEYCLLKQLLREHTHSAELKKDRGFCATFVFYSSEWYRREYTASCGWSWDPIFTSLGLSFNPTQLSHLITHGLEQFWRRPIHHYETERRDFLGSVFSEGGLPFLVLGESGSRFQSLFERILREYEQHHQWGNTTYEQVEALIVQSNFPQAFSRPNSIELIAGMADRLVGLVNDYQLTKASEPVSHLEQASPRWRELFPIPLDNKTGSDLLTGLLATATTEGKRRLRRADTWRCQHRIDENNPVVIKTELVLPQSIILTLECQPATIRFELQITENNIIVADLGSTYAQIQENRATLRPRTKAVFLNRCDSRFALVLIAKAAGVTVASQVIEGSALVIGEAPVGFEQSEGQTTFCGQASFKTQSQSVVLILPNNSEFEVISQSEQATITELPSLFSYSAIRLTGKIELLVRSEDNYRIRTAVAGSAHDSIELYGARPPYNCSPALTFIGLPQIRHSSASAATFEGIELFIGGKRPGQSLLAQMFGAQFTSVRNNQNESLLRRKIGILPQDFRLELKNDVSAGHGRILIHSAQRCVAEVLNENIKVTTQKIDGYTQLSLHAAALPPATLKLAITANLVADPIVMEIPFPGSGCFAFDGQGRPLRKNISIDELLGARLFLYGQAHNACNYTVELKLRGAVARQANYTWSYPIREKPVEISLFNLREQMLDLFSLGSSIDDVVSLEVHGPGNSPVIRIRRHATTLDYDSASLRVSTAQSHEADAVPEPIMLLLHDPVRSAMALTSRKSEGVPTGVFELPASVEHDGPWLVVPQRKSLVSFRPVFIKGNWDARAHPGEVHSLQKAVLAFDHRYNANAFNQVFDEMAVNPKHSGWSFMRALYDQYGYLPLATFEAWKALMQHPKSRAMALIIFEMDSEFLNRLETEFPLTWEFLPIEHLHQAIGYQRAFLISAGVAETNVRQVLSNMLQRLETTFPSFGLSLQHYVNDIGVGAEQRIPEQMIVHIINGWYQGLIQQRSNDSWPDWGAKALEHWHKTLKKPVVCIQNDLDYRNAVLYLPEFAAAVACGRVQLSEVFEQSIETIFILRQIRNFDTGWFNPVYQYCMLNNLLTPQQ
ncbi:MAG: STY4851/ECs_5259 family protein [Pseudohongiella sp.]|nr:STY4851/ECs_5259 family protein [Pseudohongiella sp.]